MIQVSNLSKSFGEIRALGNVTAEIKEGSIFGLIGSNGAGKSTFLRVLCGIYKADGGYVQIDGLGVYENTETKGKIFYISDDQYFFQNGSMNDLVSYYKKIYQGFSMERFKELTTAFQLDPKRSMNTFSKGMQKQAHIIFALSSRPKYLFCDETFDGLDPVMRQTVKRIFADEVAAGNLTPIIASHNLRELEDICDHVGLLHKGGIVFEREMNDLVQNIHKIQFVSEAPVTKGDFGGVEVVTLENRGSLYTLTARGEKNAVTSCVMEKKPVFIEALPLTLEEIFICEMEGLGYDIDKIIL